MSKYSVDLTMNLTQCPIKNISTLQPMSEVIKSSFILQGSCGVKYNQRTEERKVAIAVRAHPTIELLEDRLYVVTCGRVGFQNSRNEVSVVQLKVSLPTDPTRKIDTVLEGKRYKLRAEVLEHDSKYFFFSKKKKKNRGFTVHFQKQNITVDGPHQQAPKIIFVPANYLCYYVPS